MAIIENIEALNRINQANAKLIDSLLGILHNHVQQLSEEERKLIRDLVRDHQTLANEVKSLKM